MASIYPNHPNLINYIRNTPSGNKISDGRKYSNKINVLVRAAKILKSVDININSSNLCWKDRGLTDIGRQALDNYFQNNWRQNAKNDKTIAALVQYHNIGVYLDNPQREIIPYDPPCPLNKKVRPLQLEKKPVKREELAPCSVPNCNQAPVSRQDIKDVSLAGDIDNARIQIVYGLLSELEDIMAYKLDILAVTGENRVTLSNLGVQTDANVYYETIIGKGSKAQLYRQAIQEAMYIHLIKSGQPEKAKEFKRKNANSACEWDGKLYNGTLSYLDLFMKKNGSGNIITLLRSKMHSYLPEKMVPDKRTPLLYLNTEFVKVSGRYKLVNTINPKIFAKEVRGYIEKLNKRFIETGFVNNYGKRNSCFAAIFSALTGQLKRNNRDNGLRTLNKFTYTATDRLEENMDFAAGYEVYNKYYEASGSKTSLLDFLQDNSVNGLAIGTLESSYLSKNGDHWGITVVINNKTMILNFHQSGKMSLTSPEDFLKEVKKAGVKIDLRWLDADKDLDLLIKNSFDFTSR